MTFEQFAAAHGLIIHHLEIGRWVRVRTEDKPHHKNGSYKFLGDVGWCQNFATMPDVATWFADSDTPVKIDRAAIDLRIQAADMKMQENRSKAASKAVKIMRESKLDQHAYLDSKGFPEARGLVYMSGENNLLVIPMRVGREVVGAQLIDREGTKKFIFGQRCSGAEYLIQGKGVEIWCEGYATGLSIAESMKAINAQCAIHVCFSAGNMSAMAKAAGKGVIVADNDASLIGERSARETGLPFFIPPEVGQDFNDLHTSSGTFLASQMLRKFLQSLKK